jgi:hypothetical protein
MGQLHEFGIVQTNVQVQEEKHRKEKEEGNYGAHLYCRRPLPCFSRLTTVVAMMTWQFSSNFLGNGIVQ